MQVYRGMDIGTAKPSHDEQALVPHHMIDIVEPEMAYSVADFQTAARAALGASDRIVIAGGSGLHFRAIVDPLEFPPTDSAVRAELDAMPADEASARLLDLDPGAGDHVDMDNPRRVVRALEITELTGEVPSARAATPEARMVDEYRPLVEFAAFGLDAGAGLRSAVASRLDRMREAGFLDEVEGLADRLGPTSSMAVGYQQLLPVVRGETTPEQGFEAARRATMALAKRQRTFFRRDPRIRWISAHETALETIMRAVEVT